ncbi:hypothetical protein FA95DRAFT_1456218, partial [Auriscalpium vulgare]
MYHFCHLRGLREVWGYLWTQWYAPNQWKLWARSTSPRISRLRTTMNVENFWKQLKHDFLHNLLRPRLDHLVWILKTQVTAAYFVRADVLEDSHRLGRSKALTTYQTYFKRAWRELSRKPIQRDLTRTFVYQTDVLSWTCNCGSQKFNTHHLCKHLVQAVPEPSTRFWRQVIRRRTTPIYRHPELHAVSAAAYADPNDGSITDGDDHVWLGDAAVLGG